ncbi:hypothetical protein CGZ75_13200 [Paenibacillus herberti]|uniref:OmpR/PhoB-type domain-containing protein n=2 Tax=Paenibacillus herberti TaxID=1619309 RepID=A0A229NYW9_9BACL|nr:hypothetical protein CGZ75_13200 [Paenibacillus herberti]
MRLPDPAEPDAVAVAASPAEANNERQFEPVAVAASPAEANNERQFEPDAVAATPAEANNEQQPNTGTLQESAGPTNGRFIPLPEAGSAEAAGISTRESALLPGYEALQAANQHKQPATAQASSGYSAATAHPNPEPRPPHDIRHYGAFRLSDSERRFWKNDREILLTPTEWSLVKLLLDRYGQSVSRDEILTEVWGRYYAGDLKVVDVNIRRIRQKVEDDPSEPVIIETVWGFGYRWYRGATR